jgi:hypothetical protein
VVHLIVFHPESDDLVFDLTWRRGVVCIDVPDDAANYQEMVEEIHSHVTRGLLDWVPDDTDPTDRGGVMDLRVTPVADPRFLERYATRLRRRLKFRFLLSHKPD